jgi:ABC-type phosphate transport system substrate-binding protein
MSSHRSTPASAFARALRRSLLLVLALCLLSFASSFAIAEGSHEFLVLVHPSNPSHTVSREFVSDAFLKKTTRWSHDEAIRPVDLRPNAGTRRLFSERVLRRSVAAVRSYWQQRIFSGRGVPPPELDDDAAVVRYVLKYPGAVGYVTSGTRLEGAKVVTIY